MSKLNPEVLADAVKEILTLSKGKSQRKFIETIELQIGLKVRQCWRARGCGD